MNNTKKKLKTKISWNFHQLPNEFRFIWFAFASDTYAFLVFFFFLKDQHLLHCLWDMNSASKQMNSTPRVNSNFFIIFFIVFSFQQNKRYPNAHEVYIDLYNFSLHNKIDLCHFICKII